MTKKQISSLMSEWGKRGRGAAKRRGNAAHYSRIAKVRWNKRPAQVDPVGGGGAKARNILTRIKRPAKAIVSEQ